MVRFRLAFQEMIVDVPALSGQATPHYLSLP
jgi:hypothetical protein